MQLNVQKQTGERIKLDVVGGFKSKSGTFVACTGRTGAGCLFSYRIYEGQVSYRGAMYELAEKRFQACAEGHEFGYFHAKFRRLTQAEVEAICDNGFYDLVLKHGEDT